MPALPMRALKCGTALAVALLGTTFASTAHAGPSALTLQFSIDGGALAPIIDLGTPNIAVGDNRIEYIGSIVTSDYSISWQFFGDVNPGEAFGAFQGVALSGDITFINLTGATHNYEMNASLALNAALANAMYGGSYSVTMQSSHENGAGGVGDAVLAALNGQSMYSAGINGGTVQSDYADPFSANASPGQQNPLGTVNYGGVPGAPNIAGPASITELSHSLAFSLTGSTPGAGSPNDYDQATFSMKIVVVPAPGALALLGVAGLVGRRRRRA